MKMKRAGIGLLQAIMMMLLISGMMMIVLKYASISTKHTRNSFIREQNELFLTSAVEQTLLQISFYDRVANGNCLASSNISSVSKRGITYSAKVDIIKYYLQNSSDDLTICSTLGVGINESSDISHGMALLEVEVNATRSDGVVVCRILRRTLQQP